MKTITYVCDGSNFKGEMGAGIVRLGKNLEKFAFSTDCDKKENSHEFFAISKTLELAQHFNDKKVIIYNDDSILVNQLIEKQERKNERRQDKLHRLQQLIDKLHNDGFEIHIFHTKKMKDHNKRFLHMAHSLSRTYLKEKEELQCHS